MLSLGIGDMSIQTVLNDNAGLRRASDTINLLMSSNSQAKHEMMQSFLGNNYYRVNPLINSTRNLDNTDETTLKILTTYSHADTLLNYIIKPFVNKILEVKRTCSYEEEKKWLDFSLVYC
jgi:hypothetical protein